MKPLTGHNFFFYASSSVGGMEYKTILIQIYISSLDCYPVVNFTRGEGGAQGLPHPVSNRRRRAIVLSSFAPRSMVHLVSKSVITHFLMSASGLGIPRPKFGLCCCLNKGESHLGSAGDYLLDWVGFGAEIVPFKLLNWEDML